MCYFEIEGRVIGTPIAGDGDGRIGSKTTLVSRIVITNVT